jgi:hypothetical protein
MRCLTLLAIVAAVASCHYSSPDLTYVPDNPGYQEDVHPLFSDHCLVCHSHPADRGAPNSFRLDVYDDTDGISGAYNNGEIALGDIKSRRMPPAARGQSCAVADPSCEGVGPNGILMLQRWIDNGKPKTRP